MALTGITNTILDGALGAVPETIENKLCVIGTAAAGTANTVYAFSDVRTAQSTLTAGPLLEAVAHHLAVLGEGPVYAIRAATAAAGSVGAWTKSNGAAPDVGSGSSAANDNYQLKVLITKGGSLATAEFRFSLDGGDTYSPVIVTAATYAIANTGITLTFASGTYVANDYYTATAVADAADGTTINAAIDALLSSTFEVSLLHVCGVPTNLAGQVALASAMEAKLLTAESAERYIRCFIEAADESDSTLQGATVVALNCPHVVICGGFVELYSSVSARWYKRPAAWPIVGRAAKNKVHVHLGRVKDGPLPFIKTSGGLTNSGLYRDERITPGLTAYRYCVLRSRIGKPGYYVEDDKTFAASGSDYSSLANCRVMDKAVRIATFALQPYINADLELTSAGKLAEKEAKGIESYTGEMIKNGLIPDGNASLTSFIVSRSDLIIETQTLTVKTRVLPKGYSKFIEHEIGFARSIPTA
jgi:hypothetical protein